MKPEDFNALAATIKSKVATLGPSAKIGILGSTPVTLDLLQMLDAMKLMERFAGIYVTPEQADGGQKPLDQLRIDNPAIVIVASDKDKERLITLALPFITPQTHILVGGFSHFEFRDALFTEEVTNSLIPSFANGYPNSLIHIYQCLKNAASQNLDGVVAEFGMFKGGTTMLMSRFIERLGMNWKVYGFDSFAGFPPPRSPLDMYAHPDCVYLDEALVRRMFHGRNVEIIAGDIVATVGQIREVPIVLAFVDTDNFTSASAILDVIQDQVVPGGAIVFDHFTGRNRFLYTLGERMAAMRLLDDPRYFNLHDTGVFLRQS